MNNQNNDKVIPPEILEAIKSASVYKKLEDIGARYNLHLDQIGQLEVDTRMVLVGNSKSESFIYTVAKNLEIEPNIAEKIVKDINEEIFMGLRESLQKTQEEEEISTPKVIMQPPVNLPVQPSSPKPLSPLEKAGGFEIVNNKIASNSSQYNDKNLDKNKILQSVENPPAPTKVSFVDHLLANPVSTQHTTVEQKPPVPITPPSTPTPQIPAKPATPQEPRKPSVDPYREPIE